MSYNMLIAYHDINENNARHLIFMTETQIEIMSTSKLLYLDGTFRIINRTCQQFLEFIAL